MSAATAHDVLPLVTGPIPQDATLNAEKDVSHTQTNMSDIDEKLRHGKESPVLSDDRSEQSPAVLDPFIPFPQDPGVPEEGNILRIRSLVLGSICGALVNASNVYLGTIHTFIVVQWPSY